MRKTATTVFVNVYLGCYVTVHSRIEWFSTFFRFLKAYTFLLIRYIFWGTQFQKVSNFGRACARRKRSKVFNFTGTLKINIFTWTFAETFLILCLYQKTKYKNKIWIYFLNILFFIFRKWASLFLICTRSK